MSLVIFFYQIIVWPRFFSPLRSLPSPPSGGYILGHVTRILTSEPGVLPLEWAKKYGPVVRTMGPLGHDRLMFFRPEALRKILVTDWQDYPRVRNAYPVFLLYEEHKTVIAAKVHARLPGHGRGVWPTYRDRR